MFSFIAAEKTNYPVAVMCRVFGVNRTGFHNWERRPPSDRALQDAWLTEKIRRIHVPGSCFCLAAIAAVLELASAGRRSHA